MLLKTEIWTVSVSLWNTKISLVHLLAIKERRKVSMLRYNYRRKHPVQESFLGLLNRGQGGFSGDPGHSPERPFPCVAPVPGLLHLLGVWTAVGGGGVRRGKGAEI